MDTSPAQPLFPFSEASQLVNARRVNQKIPSLLLENCSKRNKKGWNKYIRYSYRLRQFKKRNPERANALFNKLLEVLKEYEEAIQ